MEKKRSVGITILAILMILDALASTIFLFTPLLGFFMLLSICAVLICVVGLLMLKEWARKATIWVYAIEGVFAIIGLFLMLTILPEVRSSSHISPKFVRFFLTSSVAFWALVKFLIPFFYLTRPKVKEQFK